MDINTSYQSPNFDVRDGQVVDMLIMHYTDMANHEVALERLCDPDAKVSAHYLIAKNGEIFQLVEETHRAWHAGVSHWRGHDNINARSIGIELCNTGHQGGCQPYPKEQMASLLILSKAILARHDIPARNVQGHSDIAFMRKTDPGEWFNWRWLAQHGVGIFPDDTGFSKALEQPDERVYQSGDSGADIRQLQQSLTEWGYGLAVDGVFGEQTEKCITAFQRHYVPDNISGNWNEYAASVLRALYKEIR